MSSKKILIIAGSIVAIFAISIFGFISIKKYEKQSEINRQTEVERIKIQQETELQKAKIEKETELERTKERMGWVPWYSKGGKNEDQ
jgi:hypothetical protein